MYGKSSPLGCCDSPLGVVISDGFDRTRGHSLFALNAFLRGFGLLKNYIVGSFWRFLEILWGGFGANAAENAFLIDVPGARYIVSVSVNFFAHPRECIEF